MNPCPCGWLGHAQMPCRCSAEPHRALSRAGVGPAARPDRHDDRRAGGARRSARRCVRRARKQANPAARCASASRRARSAAHAPGGAQRASRCAAMRSATAFPIAKGEDLVVRAMAQRMLSARAFHRVSARRAHDCRSRRRRRDRRRRTSPRRSGYRRSLEHAVRGRARKRAAVTWTASE